MEDNSNIADFMGIPEEDGIHLDKSSINAPNKSCIIYNQPIPIAVNRSISNSRIENSEHTNLLNAREFENSIHNQNNFFNNQNLNNSNNQNISTDVSNQNNPNSNNSQNNIEKNIKNLEFTIINNNENKNEFKYDVKEMYLKVKIKNNSRNKVFENTIGACIYCIINNPKPDPQIEKEKFYIEPSKEKEWNIILKKKDLKFLKDEFPVELDFLVKENLREIKSLSTSITILRP